MNSLKFLVSFVVFFLITAGCYTGFYQCLLVKEQPILPDSYKQFLLENIQGKRIIFESGSNGYHSINGDVVEDILGYPVIVLCDWAGASLHDKIERLIRNCRKGDVVILPLEWGYYRSGSLSEQHLKKSFYELNHYFYSLSFWSRCLRPFQTPLEILIWRLNQNDINQRDDLKTELKRLRFFEKHYSVNGVHGEGFGVMKGNPLDFNCSEYISRKSNSRSQKLGGDFVSGLKKLTWLKRKGVSVIVIPPVVVGRDCYASNEEEFLNLVSQTNSILDKLGIGYVSDFKLFEYGESYFLDTPYHLNAAGRDIFSEWLCGYLLDHKLVLPKKIQRDLMVKSQIERLFPIKKKELIREHLIKWNGMLVEFDEFIKSQKFYLGNDWEIDSDKKLVAEDIEGDVFFVPADIKDAKALRLGFFFNEVQPILNVYLNGKFFCKMDFSKSNDLVLQGELLNFFRNQSLIHLYFKHESSNGRTQHSFGLESMQIICDS